MRNISVTETQNLSNANAPRAYAKAYAGMAKADETASLSDGKTLWRLIQMILNYRFRISIAIIAIIFAAAFQLAIPHLVGDAVDNALGMLGEKTVPLEVSEQGLWHAAMFLLGASALRGVFTLIHNYIGEAIGHRLAFDLRLSFYRKLQTLSFSFYDHIHSGELITRGMLDVEGVRMFVNTGLLRIVLLLVLVSAGAWMLISSDLVLGLLSLSFVPFVAWRSASTRLKLRFLWFLFQDRMEILGRIMDENLTGIRIVRAFGAEKHELSKYDIASDEAMELSSKRIKSRVFSTTQMTFAYYLSMGLVLWIGGIRVINGAISVGTLIEFLTFITILQLPVRQLGLVVNSLARASTCGARLFTVLDLASEIADETNAQPLNLSNGKVCFKNVSFSYRFNSSEPPDVEPNALKNVSFEVQKGKTLGIVGPPGSGKSTIANLLPRHYDVTEGKITIDGQDIRDVSLASLRQAVRIIPQDPFLFTASLENNIAYGNPYAAEEHIQHSASIAQLHNFIKELPNHYHSLVGERGLSLSGGQKQRAAIARTALLKPTILVLDDSMAAIDGVTENRIRNAFIPLMAEAATIIISHRLSTLCNSDEIIVLDAGRIIERGTHENLIKQKGYYEKLFAMQTSQNSDADKKD